MNELAATLQASLDSVDPEALDSMMQDLPQITEQLKRIDVDALNTVLDKLPALMTTSARSRAAWIPWAPGSGIWRHVPVLKKQTKTGRSAGNFLRSGRLRRGLCQRLAIALAIVGVFDPLAAVGAMFGDLDLLQVALAAVLIVSAGADIANDVGIIHLAHLLTR